MDFLTRKPMIRRFALLASLVLFLAPLHGNAQTPAASFPQLLNASQAGAILPPSVFFSGQSAPTQARNSAGVRFSKDAMLLATLVDNSGYSSAIQQKYQAYLITESPIELGGHHLPPGAYGCGFIAGDNFIVMDIGGHDLFTIKSMQDPALHRPTPLQILASPAPQHYRLYAGRSFVEFSSTN
jgi:hypothetical protein